MHGTTVRTLHPQGVAPVAAARAAAAPEGLHSIGQEAWLASAEPTIEVGCAKARFLTEGGRHFLTVNTWLW